MIPLPKKLTFNKLHFEVKKGVFSNYKEEDNFFYYRELK